VELKDEGDALHTPGRGASNLPRVVPATSKMLCIWIFIYSFHQEILYSGFCIRYALSHSLLHDKSCFIWILDPLSTTKPHFALLALVTSCFFFTATHERLNIVVLMVNPYYIVGS
jgi:hypothetical protein